MVVQAFNPNTQESQAGLFEFEAGLVYVVSSNTARATQRNPVSKKPKGRERVRETAHTFCNPKDYGQV